MIRCMENDIIREIISNKVLISTDKNYLPRFTVNAKATYQSDVPTVPLEVPGVTIVPVWPTWCL
jgi:hypothetical protein